MVRLRAFRTVFAFLFLYVVLSLPPFLYLNREVLDDVLDSLAVADPFTLVWLLVGGSVLVGLLQAHEGVDRYNQFFTVPTGPFALVVTLSFVLAAVSWWLVPELFFTFELQVTLTQLLSLILACQIPMVVFLSFMTILERTPASSR